MRASWPFAADGLLTGLAIAGILVLPCLAGGAPGDCGARIFLVGVGLAFASALWTLAFDAPPGIVALATGKARPQRPAPERGPIWLDRFVSPRNTWLVAGSTMVLVSFLPPLLGT